MEKITIDDLKKVEIKIGKILSAEPILGSEKLLKLSVDFGITLNAQKEITELSEVSLVQNESVEERDIRQVLSGIAKHFPEGVGLVGTLCAFITNLEPRMMMGMESQAMILATSGESFFSLLRVSDDTPEGSVVQ